MTAPPPPPRNVEEAGVRVLDLLRSLASGGVVAASGGTDSALVLHLVAEAWGPGRVVAATSCSGSVPREEVEAARAQAAGLGVEHVVFDSGELEVEAYRRNAPDRCFHCKHHLFEKLRALATDRGVPHVLDGANADDVGDHRPGLDAARALDVLSPLLRAGLTKPWVRALSKLRGLDTWDKPAQACLASRFPYGTEVTAEGLERVDRAERALKALGFTTVRVRVHDPVARIELPVADLPALLAPGVRERAVAAVREAGFGYVALDIEGFRSGSLNEVLS